MKKEWKNRREFTEACPNCGNNIEALAKPGEIRKCPFCRRRYVVRYEKRNRRYLEEYIKIVKESDENSCFSPSCLAEQTSLNQGIACISN